VCVVSTLQTAALVFVDESTREIRVGKGVGDVVAVAGVEEERVSFLYCSFLI